MSVLIIAVGLAVRFGHWAVLRGVNRRTQAWLLRPAEMLAADSDR
jgi:hypothetical protein